MEITIKDLWNVFKRFLILILVCAILCGAAAYFYTTKYMQKVYSSSIECVLLPRKDITAGETDAVGNQKSPEEVLNNYLVVGGRAIKSLARILMAENTMAAVLNDIKGMSESNPGDSKYITKSTYTANQLRKLFTFTMPEDDTDLVFTVSCNAYSAHDTYVLLSAFGRVMNQRADAFWGEETFKIELCEEPKMGVLGYPHVNRITAIATAAGALVPYFIVLAFTLFNSRIKKEEDIKNNFEYPLLGRVPHFG